MFPALVICHHCCPRILFRNEESLITTRAYLMDLRVSFTTTASTVAKSQSQQQVSRVPPYQSYPGHHVLDHPNYMLSQRYTSVSL